MALKSVAVKPAQALQQAMETKGTEVIHLLPGDLLKGVEITVEIPDDATLEQVESTLHIGIDRYKELQSAQEQLGPIIGRVLLTVQSRTMFRPEFKTFTAWLTERVVNGMHISKSTCFDWLKVARAFPNLTSEEYKEYGATRLLLASRAVNEETEGYREVLEESKTLTTDLFKDRIAELRKSDTARPKPYIVAVRTNQETYNKWVALVEANKDKLTVAEIFQQVLDYYFVGHGMPQPKAVVETPATTVVAQSPLTKKPVNPATAQPGAPISQGTVKVRRR